MKVCTKCGESKSESEYFIRSKKTGHLHAQCKTCYKSHRTSYYTEHYKLYGETYRQRAIVRRANIKTTMRAKMLDYLKDKSCVICGENDIRTFEFDHLDPKTKSFSITRGINHGPTWEVVMSEINKCRILCANCHKKHTASQQNWYKAVL